MSSQRLLNLGVSPFYGRVDCRFACYVYLFPEEKQLDLKILNHQTRRYAQVPNDRTPVIFAGPWSLAPRGSIVRQLVVYFVAVFGVTWGIAAILLLQPEFLVSRYGPVDVATPFYAVVFFCAVWTPTVVGFLLTFFYSGSIGLRELWRRILLWRVGPYAFFVIFGIPAFYLFTDWVLYGVLSWPLGAANYHHDFIGWFVALAGGAIITDPGPLGEEVGWRGFAFPRLMAVLPFWKAELLLGIAWGLWHVPAFYIASTGQSTLNMVWFIAGAVALSFIMGSVFVATRGSVLYSGFIVHYFANQLPDLQQNIQMEVLRFVLLALLAHLLGRFTSSRGHLSTNVPSNIHEPIRSEI
jgi:uncharacterized protein